MLLLRLILARQNRLQKVETKHLLKPMLLFTQVGTQIDLRDDPQVLQDLHKRKQKPISSEMGQKRAAKLGACGYQECSAVTLQGIKDVFDEAIRTVLFPPKSNPHDKKNCTIS